MTKVFIAGSISIKRLPDPVKSRVDNMLSAHFDILVGDANGVDAEIQRYLPGKAYANVLVYCSGIRPRNNLGGWRTQHVDTTHRPGSREFFTEKDVAMAADADYGLMVWDGESSGTLNNVLNMLARGCKTLVYLYQAGDFFVISDACSLQNLLALVPEKNIANLNRKIYLQKKIKDLKVPDRV